MIFLCQSTNTAETSWRTGRFRNCFQITNNKAYELFCHTSTHVCPHGFNVHHQYSFAGQYSTPERCELYPDTGENYTQTIQKRLQSRKAGICRDQNPKHKKDASQKAWNLGPTLVETTLLDNFHQLE
jgi:hypothetical protein